MLRQIIGALPIPSDPRVLVSFENSEDAAVYKISDDRALVVTIDVITPLVDDPETYGKIAAANSFSDIYAMGGKALLSLSYLAIPADLPPAIGAAILKGASEIALEAGAPILGGHTVESRDFMFGLTAVGEAHPQKLFLNDRLRDGDQLLLTKPLGTGSLMSALKNDKISLTDVGDALTGMMQLNKNAVEPMLMHGVVAATDITGFSLLGHAAEMARASGVRVVIHQKDVPAYGNARETLGRGIVTRGNKRNLAYVQSLGPLEGSPEPLLLDPQTSGGLLVAVRPENAQILEAALKKAGYRLTTRVGEIRKGAGIEVC